MLYVCYVFIYTFINILKHNALKNKYAYFEMAKRNTDVWQLMRDHHLLSVYEKRSKNRFVLKSFFRVLCDEEKLGTHHFSDFVKLIGVG